MKKLLFTSELPIFGDIRRRIRTRACILIAVDTLLHTYNIADNILNNYYDLGRFSTPDQLQELSDKYIPYFVHIHDMPADVMKSLFGYDANWQRLGRTSYCRVYNTREVFNIYLRYIDGCADSIHVW